MIFTLEQLKSQSKYRSIGYDLDVLLKSKLIDKNKYEISESDLKELDDKYEITTIGLGDAVTSIIHFGIDISPATTEFKRKIKNCNKCKKRAIKLNEFIPDINPFN